MYHITLYYLMTYNFYYVTLWYIRLYIVRYNTFCFETLCFVTLNPRMPGSPVIHWPGPSSLPWGSLGIPGKSWAQAMVERIAAMDVVPKRSSLVKLHDAAGQQFSVFSRGLHVRFSHGDKPAWSYSGFGDHKSCNL